MTDIMVMTKVSGARRRRRYGGGGGGGGDGGGGGGPLLLGMMVSRITLWLLLVLQIVITTLLPIVDLFVVVQAQFSLCEDGNSVLVVDAGQAYSWSSSFPQSCQCEETGVTNSACTQFDCSCICDLTAGKCDYNCCCDSECTATEIERFQALGACLEEGPAPSTVVECYSKQQLSEINPTFPMTTYSTAETAINQVLCVQYDNSNSKGEYISDPGTFSAAIFSDSAATTAYSYPEYMNIQPQGATEGDETLDLGDRMPAAFFDDGNGMVTAFGGYMSVPVGNNDGVCNENNYAAFEVPVSGNACNRQTAVSDLEQVCSTMFGSWRFAKTLYIGTDGSVTPSSSSSPEDGTYVAVDVASIMYEEWNTGNLIDFQSGYNCDAYYYDGNVSSTSTSTSTSSNWNCTLPSGLKIKDYAEVDFTASNVNQNIHHNYNATGNFSTTTTTTSTSTSIVSAPANEPDNSTYVGCHNALRSVCYTVIHDADGHIVQVLADVIITDLPISTAGTDGVLGLTQEFRVQYQSTADVARDADQGNFVNRTRSGNPGYEVGKPILVGNLVDNAYMSSPVEGMTLMKGASGSGMCGSGDINADNAGDYLTTVAFGYDVMSCCMLTLTRSELKSLCNGDIDYAEPDGFTPSVFNYNMQQNYVGLYGNADPLDPSQWLQLSVITGTDTSSWNEHTGTCNNQIISQDIKLLYASVGATTNLQNKIVATEAVFDKNELVWTAEDSTKQNFMFCSTVTFIEYDEQSTLYATPPPPIGLQMPWDVFYPFDIQSAAPPSTLSSPLIFIIPLLMAAALLYSSE